VDIPYPIGSIQLPGGQFPLLLLNDGVTGGGYATIGTVIRSDLDVVGQLKPGDKVIFKSIGIAEALRIRKRKILRISKIKKALEYPF
jgi:allophanate hydrolase subunit 2